MRVVHLTWEFPPSSAGGVAAHVDGLAHGLCRAGHEVVVVTRRIPGTATDTTTPGGVRVLRADVDLPWLPDHLIARTTSANHALAAAVAPLAADGWLPEVIHAHDWEAAWAAGVVAAWSQAPLVTTFHGTERGRHGGHLPPGQPADINAIEWWQATRSVRVIATTRLMVRGVVDGFELDPDMVHRVPAGIDPTWWRQPSPGEPVGVPRSGRVFTWGRVQYEKGFQVLARAISLLRGRLIGLECTIAGRGSYLPELQSQIDIAGVGDVIDVPGFLGEDELRAALHDAGVVVIPSLYEPFGLVALEALAGGAPLIVANTGGLAELVAGTGAALLFEPGNADQLADCIETVLTDQRLAAEMSVRGAELLEASYSWDAIAARTQNVYERARG
ncbi:MAG TPA: glycosyltransferase family 4 protein [Ilumatobacter sp.]|nr:glycosyltransferase family 4 protein [Ilumatobacter sp.]